MIIYREDLKIIYKYLSILYKDKISWKLIMEVVKNLNKEDEWNNIDIGDLSAFLVSADKQACVIEIVRIIKKHLTEQL